MNEHDPVNAFEPEFFNDLDKKGFPPVTLTEAAYVGPWEVVRQGDEWAVKREADTTPRVVTEFRETACMVAAVLPAVGRPPIYAAPSQPPKPRDLDVRCQGTRTFATLGDAKFDDPGGYSFAFESGLSIPAVGAVGMW